jgi:hypothetical protein
MTESIPKTWELFTNSGIPRPENAGWDVPVQGSGRLTANLSPAEPLTTA